jgi:hypothetical protein
MFITEENQAKPQVPCLRVDTNTVIRLDSSLNCKKALKVILGGNKYYRTSKFDSGYITTALRHDATAVGIFGRTLELFLQEEIRRRKPQEDSSAYIFTDFRNQLWGIREINTPYIEQAGNVTYGEGTTDINYASVTMRYEGVKLTMMRIGLYWTQRDLDIDMQQMQSSLSSGLSIVEENIRNAYEIFNEIFHRDAFYGIPSQGIEGLLSDSRTPDEAYTTFFPYAEDRAGLYNWIKNLPLIVSENSSRFLKRPNTLLMSENLMFKLMDIDATTDASLTAFDMLKRNMGDLGITTMKALPQLNKEYLEKYGIFSAGDNKEMIKLYNNDSSCLRRYASDVRVFNPMLNEQEEYKGHLKQIISSTDNFYPLETLNVIYPTTLS